jgi:aspartate aminotransferase
LNALGFKFIGFSSTGGKQVFYNLCQAVLDTGDEVIIPSPYWVSYPDMVILANATPVIVKTGLEQDFKITPEQLEANITDKTKLFVINSPSNPTGAVYSKAELQALATVLKKHPQVLIITDDIYEHVPLRASNAAAWAMEQGFEVDCP